MSIMELPGYFVVVVPADSDYHPPSINEIVNLPFPSKSPRRDIIWQFQTENFSVERFLKNLNLPEISHAT